MASSVWMLVCVAVLVNCAASVRFSSRPSGGRMNHGLQRHVEAHPRPMGDGPFIGWHTQRVNHFDSQDTRTFLQQFQVNSTFYKTDGPVFLLLGGEGPASPLWLSIDTALMTYARDFGAMAVQLEHRFYGKSRPFSDLSTENLQYLSSQQALADTAAFIDAFRTNHSLPEHTPVVVFGGSYSGALAAFFRTKYPHMAIAAVATSAPVLAKLDFFEYHEVVGASLATADAACPARVANASATVQSMLDQPEGRTKLIADFNVTDSELLLPLDKQNFMASLAGNLDGVVQYNLDNRDFEGGPPPPTVPEMCRIMTNATFAPYDAYVALQKFLLNGSSMEVSYASMVGMLKNTSLASAAAEGGRQWTYQTCAEFGYYQTTDASDQPFGSDVSLSLSLKQCLDVFGINTSDATIRWTNDYYGGLAIRGTRIIYPNGSIDPWHKLGLVAKTNVPDTEVIYITGTAHCANMYPPAASDISGLKKAREDIHDTLKKWLSEW